MNPSTTDNGVAGKPHDASADSGLPDVLPTEPTARRGKGLTHELVEALTAQLRAKTLRAGDKLPTELEIVRAFGVSRGVVREALSRLQAAGWVETQHGIGTFALDAHTEGRFRLNRPAHLGLKDMLDVLELRGSLESEAASMAANRHIESHLEAMRAALDDFAANVSAIGETVAPDFRFHLAIAHATGNRYFGELMGQLGLAVIPRSRVSSARLDVEQRARHLQKVHQEHQDIYDAIARRDPEAARAAMRIHLVNSRERQRQAHSEEMARASPTDDAGPI